MVPKRRAEVYVTSKTEERKRDAALRQVEQSLRNMRIDHLDLIQIHLIQPDEDLDFLVSKEGAYRALLDLKRQKVVRAVGITGHLAAVKMTQLVERMEELDTSSAQSTPTRTAATTFPQRDDKEPNGHFEERVLPAARRRGLGIIAMKTMAQGELMGPGAGKATPAVLLRYALSELPASARPSWVRAGMEFLRQNLATAQKLAQLTIAEHHRAWPCTSRVSSAHSPTASHALGMGKPAATTTTADGPPAAPISDGPAGSDRSSVSLPRRSGVMHPGLLHPGRDRGGRTARRPGFALAAPRSRSGGAGVAREMDLDRRRGVAAECLRLLSEDAGACAAAEGGAGSASPPTAATDFFNRASSDAVRRGPTGAGSPTTPGTSRSHLKAGRNAVAILVHHYGEFTFRLHHARPRRPDRGPGGGRRPTAGADRRRPGARCGAGMGHRAARMSIQLGFDGIYDARRSPAGGPASTSPTGAWPAAVVRVPAGMEPWPRLVARDIPPMREEPLQATRVWRWPRSRAARRFSTLTCRRLGAQDGRGRLPPDRYRLPRPARGDPRPGQ